MPNSLYGYGEESITTSLLEQGNSFLHSKSYPYTDRYAQLPPLIKKRLLYSKQTITENLNWTQCRDQ